MKKVNWIVMCMASVTLALYAGGCKSRTGTSGPSGGVSPIDGIYGDSIFAEGLGAERFGLDGQYIEGQFHPVLFAFDSAQIGPAERPKLEEVATHLRRNPADRLIVEGHTDERGSREYNLSLGERRALAARAYLVGLGIDGSRVQTRSFGAERPSSFGHDEAAWSQNRRAEFVITQ